MDSFKPGYRGDLNENFIEQVIMIYLVNLHLFISPISDGSLLNLTTLEVPRFKFEQEQEQKSFLKRA